MMKSLTYILISLFFIGCQSQLCTRDAKLVQERENCINTGHLKSGSRPFTMSVPGFSHSCFDCAGHMECFRCQTRWNMQCTGSEQGHAGTINGCAFTENVWKYDEFEDILRMQNSYATRQKEFGCSYTSPFGKQAGMIVIGFAGFCLLLIAFFGYLAKELGLDCRRVKEKYGDLQAKFLLGEVHLIAVEGPDGKLKWSFWKSYFVMLASTAPILGMWFISKSHFSSRLDKTVVVLFSVSYGMLAELIVVLYPKVLNPSYFFKLAVVTIPNAVLWNKLSEKFDREGAIVDYRRKEGEWPETYEDIAASECQSYKDRAKNIFFVVFSLGLCVVSFIKLQEESNPKCFVVNFLFNAMVMAFFIQAAKMFLDFYCKWYCYIDNYDTLGDGSWARFYLDVAASLPPSASLHPRFQQKKDTFISNALSCIKGCLCCCCMSSGSGAKNRAEVKRNEVIEHMKKKSYKSILSPHLAEGAIAEGEAFEQGIKIMGASAALSVLEANLHRMSHSGDEAHDHNDKTRKILKMFDKMDVNGDGHVSKKELLEALKQNGDENFELVMGENFKKVFAEIDVDGNEMLSKKEFLDLIPELDETTKRSITNTASAESPRIELVAGLSEQERIRHSQISE